MTKHDSRVADIERRISNTVVIGTVSKVDHAKGRYRVKSGDLETDWLPLAVSRAGSTKTYSSVEEGEQVIIAAQSGDLSQGVIIGAVPKDDTQASDKGNIHQTVYPDGTTVEYDHEAKTYKMDVASGGSFVLNIGGGGASITGAGNSLNVKAGTIKLEGDVDVIGTIKNNGVNIGDDHAHESAPPGVPGPPLQ